MVEAGPVRLSLADNREVSPSPVSHFIPKNQIGHNRVSLPFNGLQKTSSFKVCSSFDPISGSGAADGMTKPSANFRASQRGDSRLTASLFQPNVNFSGVSDLVG